MSDYGYFGVSESDKQVLGNIRDMAQHLKDLALNVVSAEAALKEAKEAYDNYRFKVLPTEMLSAGIQTVTLEDGSTISIKNKFYCNPNKNEEDRRAIAAWLKQRGAEHLIKTSAVVDGAQLDKLKDADVPYVEMLYMNTNSLKAWIKSQLGVDGGDVHFNIADIPECIHFSQVDEAEIKA